MIKLTKKEPDLEDKNIFNESELFPKKQKSFF